MPKENQIIEPINASLDQVSSKIFSKIDDGKNFVALYSSPLAIANSLLECVVLNDQDHTRVINATSVFKAFDRTARGNNRLINIPAFIDAKGLQPFIDQEVVELIKPIEYSDGGKMKKGFNALILPAICDIYLKARRAGELAPQQVHLAEKAEILQSAFAKVGIIALIDEATGFQRDRGKDALRLLVQYHIAQGIQKWIKTFPDNFFDQLDKLYGNEKTTSRNRPQYYGGFINKYVYDPIENGYIKKEIDKLNIKEDGKRKGRFHQWFSENGKNILMIQIGKILGFMEFFEDIEDFKKAMKKQKSVSIAPYLFDEMNNIID